MAIDISSLEKALGQLQVGIEQVEADPSQELLRDGVIQRFKYSYELALKMIKRIFEVEFGDPIDQMPFKDVLRTAHERGFIQDPTAWFTYRDERNRTSHTYDRSIAAEVYQSARTFALLLSDLVQHLRSRPAA